MSTRHLPASALFTTAAVLAAIGTTALTANAAIPPTVASVSGGTLTVVAGLGDDNRIIISQTVPATEVRVRDAAAQITATFPCSNLSPNEITCPANFAQRLDIDLRDGDDVVRNTTPRPSFLRGGPGDDQLSGEAGADVFIGGLGIDTVTYEARTAPVTVAVDALALDGAPNEQDEVRTDVENVRGGQANDVLVGSATANGLSGGAGNDFLIGGSGDDLLDGGPGADRMGGGLGSDTVTYATRAARVDVSLDGLPDDGQAGEADNALSDVENAIGGGAADRLTGNARPNHLEGRSGSDVLAGLDGPDLLTGGADVDAGNGGAGPDVCNTEVTVNCP
jgi:Ca2+-binding RTX toxin-like protein